MATDHSILGGKVHVYQRDNSPYWQCSSYMERRNFRTSTKRTNLEDAKAFAEEWFLGLRVKQRSGELKGGKKFKIVADQFEREYAALVAGERNPRYVKSHGDRLRVHLLPFFGEKPVTEITPGLVREYLVHRMTSRKNAKTGEPMRPSRSTLHHETVTLRLVLKTAADHGWLKFLPDLSPPYKASGKISHRAWFSNPEYATLLKAVKRRSENPPKPRWTWECEQMHDYVVFMVNTGLRPDEASRLEFRDVEIVKDQATQQTILEISVRGKRGVGYCKSMPAAVFAFERIRDRMRPARQNPEAMKAEAKALAEGRKLETDEGKKGVDAKLEELKDKEYKTNPTDKLFPNSHRELFNTILAEEGLKKDREGRARAAYSLRHTYICFRLMEGADIYQIAKNCRTSVEMIEKFYAAHIKNMIDAAAVNVRRKGSNDPTPKREANAKKREGGAKPRKTGGKFGNPKYPR